MKLIKVFQQSISKFEETYDIKRFRKKSLNQLTIESYAVKDHELTLDKEKNG